MLSITHLESQGFFTFEIDPHGTQRNNTSSYSWQFPSSPFFLTFDRKVRPLPQGLSLEKCCSIFAVSLLASWPNVHAGHAKANARLERGLRPNNPHKRGKKPCMNSWCSMSFDGLLEITPKSCYGDRFCFTSAWSRWIHLPRTSSEKYGNFWKRLCQHIGLGLSPTLVTSVGWSHGHPNVITRCDRVTSSHIMLRLHYVLLHIWFVSNCFLVRIKTLCFLCDKLPNIFLHFVTSAFVSNAFYKFGSFPTSYYKATDNYIPYTYLLLTKYYLLLTTYYFLL